MSQNSEKVKINDHHCLNLHLDTHCLPYLIDILDTDHDVLENEINNNQLKEDTYECDDLSKMIAVNLSTKKEKYKHRFLKESTPQNFKEFFKKKRLFRYEFS